MNQRGLIPPSPSPLYTDGIKITPKTVTVFSGEVGVLQRGRQRQGQNCPEDGGRCWESSERLLCPGDTIIMNPALVTQVRRPPSADYSGSCGNTRCTFWPSRFGSRNSPHTKLGPLWFTRISCGYGLASKEQDPQLVHPRPVSNPLAHYDATAQEILEQCDGLRLPLFRVLNSFKCPSACVPSWIPVSRRICPFIFARI